MSSHHCGGLVVAEILVREPGRVSGGLAIVRERAGSGGRCSLDQGVLGVEELAGRLELLGGDALRRHWSHCVADGSAPGADRVRRGDDEGVGGSVD